MSPKGPFRLMTVNTAPDRAKRVIGALIENLKERYTIDYIANSTCVCKYLALSSFLITSYSRKSQVDSKLQ